MNWFSQRIRLSISSLPFLFDLTLTCFPFASLDERDQRLVSWSSSWNFNPKQEEQTGVTDACSKKRLAVAYPRWSSSGKRTSPVRSRILSLPILIKEDLAFWWQPVLCQFSSKKIQLLDDKICHYAKDYGLVQEKGLSCPVGLTYHLGSRQDNLYALEAKISLYERQSWCSINVSPPLNQ